SSLTISFSRQQRKRNRRPDRCVQANYSLINDHTDMLFLQEEIQLKPRKRGFHLITQEILNAMPRIRDIERGQLQVFIKHTSAGLTINENADPSVRKDFESFM